MRRANSSSPGKIAGSEFEHWGDNANHIKVLAAASQPEQAPVWSLVSSVLSF